MLTGSKRETPAPAAALMPALDARAPHFAAPPVAMLEMRHRASNPSWETARSSGDQAPLNEGCGQSERSRISFASPTGAICRLVVPTRLIRYETGNGVPAFREA